MRGIYEAARFTQPAKLRCRPSISTYPVARPFATGGSSSHNQEENNQADITIRESSFNKAEKRDYELALDLAQRSGAFEQASSIQGHAQQMRNSPLPSLFKHMANANNSILDHNFAAGPSSLRLPSRKGKERQLDEGTRGKPKLAHSLGESEIRGEPISGPDPLTTGPRRNPVGVQLLAPALHAQLFPGTPLLRPPSSLLDISLDHLAAHGLSPDGAAVLPEISFDLPKLQGGNIREHFQAVGSHTAEPYLSMARSFVEADLPPMPEVWETNRSGWTRYGKDGSVQAVNNLAGESVISFDVETLYKISPYPVMATAASPNAWYSWLCPSIFEDPLTEEPASQATKESQKSSRNPRTLVPLFNGDSPSLVVGHNVGYDRARVAEEYSLERTPTRWLDTLSLHVATRGITSVQRPAWIKHRKDKLQQQTMQHETMDVLLEEAIDSGDDSLVESIENYSDTSITDESKWEDTTSVNSLAEVAKLHCGIPVDKSIRDRFGDVSIRHASQLKPELSDLLSYCANDVSVTHAVYKHVLPLFLNSCPHPATFAGVLSMGNSFLPVDGWEDYLRNAEAKYQELNESVRRALRTLADKIRAEGPKENDPWTSQLDWTPKGARWTDDDYAGSDSTTAAHVSAGDEAPHDQVDKVVPMPRWFSDVAHAREALVSTKSQRDLLPLILRLSYCGYPVFKLHDHFWCFKAPLDAIADLVPDYGPPVDLSNKDANLESLLETSVFFRISRPGEPRRAKLVGKAIARDVKAGKITSAYPKLLLKIISSDLEDNIDDLFNCAKEMMKAGPGNDWGMQLDWGEERPQSPSLSRASHMKRTVAGKDLTWPKWYWDLSAPSTSKKAIGPKELDLTVRKTVAPLLLRMQWKGFPLAYSKAYKWIYRVPKEQVSSDVDSPLNRTNQVSFKKPVKGDERFSQDKEFAYFRIPHKDGEGHNVGNPLSKAFLRAVESGELSSAFADDGDSVSASAASAAINMNALCSYWISSRERIMGQFVVYDEKGQGMILPQVITMGTVTRRAVESTWLTASNAKKNRVGSELKAMVRAPPGYSIVGADVDSEELWISSVMGDSQFSMHGATAIGWMTLEGTKSAGTDLHSKTAKILGISRDGAKVFNYSRIYGAGKPHAIQLLLQSDAKLTHKEADRLATDLYKATKGVKTFRDRGKPPAANQYVWHGGSESFLFNTLEAIALMDRPTTPALGCGVTRALRKSFLDSKQSYLPSRINWVVQSSGVDYLHLLIASMEYLIARYNIQARYLISVHDEVRYLAKEEDRYRTALALQVANVWTRALFCYNLGLDDMPQGVAFFSAVDVDHILRKETDMTCITPSHPTALPPGESLDIKAILSKTGGVLGERTKENQASLPKVADQGPPVALFADIRSQVHKRFLEAQAHSKSGPAKRWLDEQPPIVVDGGNKGGDGISNRRTHQIAVENEEDVSEDVWIGERGPATQWSEADMAEVSRTAFRKN